MSDYGDGPKRDRPDPCVNISRLIILAITANLIVTAATLTLTINLLFKLNLQVALPTQSLSGTPTTGGTCCQFNLQVSNQSPSVITTRSDSCCDSRDEGGNKKRVVDSKRDQRVVYAPVYPVYEHYPRPKRVRRRAPPPPCCWDW